MKTVNKEFLYELKDISGREVKRVGDKNGCFFKQTFDYQDYYIEYIEEDDSSISFVYANGEILYNIGWTISEIENRISFGDWKYI